MKKIIKLVFFFILITSSFSIASSADNDAIGYVDVKNDIVFINGCSIPSLQLPNGYAYVFVEDLENYGFNTYTNEYNIGKLNIRIERDITKDTNIIYRNDEKQLKILETVNEVYLDSDTPANVYTADGKTIIQCDELAKYGTFEWDVDAGKIYINFAGVPDTSTDSIHPLPSTAQFKSIFGISSADEIIRGVIVYNDIGKSAEISLDDAKKLLNIYYSAKILDRVVKPYMETRYINLYTEYGKHTIFLTGCVCYGKFGEGNYIWYTLPVANGSNAYYTAFNNIVHTYMDTAVPTTEPPALSDNSCLSLPQDEWAVPEIQRAAAMNILPYTISYEYENPISREDFCDLAVQMLCENTAHGISSRCLWGLHTVLDDFVYSKTGSYAKDVEFPDLPYSYPVSRLANLGIINGRDDGTFDPNGYITREEAAKILKSIAELYINLSYDDAEFNDSYLMSDWARDSIKWCKNSGVMTGIGENLFAPKNTYTREQAIATMVRLYEIIKQ